jgi:hypothetical protein
MDRIVLGVALASVFALPAIGADIPTKETSAEHAGARLACHWVGKDRTLRPLHYTTTPVHRAPQVQAVAPVAAPAFISRPIAQIALMVGIAF